MDAHVRAYGPKEHGPLKENLILTENRAPPTKSPSHSTKRRTWAQHVEEEEHAAEEVTEELAAEELAALEEVTVELTTEGELAEEDPICFFRME